MFIRIKGKMMEDIMKCPLDYIKFYLTKKKMAILEVQHRIVYKFNKTLDVLMISLKQI
jgi:hypothetical protein